jgi:hypothetical protein
MATKPLEITEQECNEQLALHKGPQSAVTPMELLQSAVNQNLDIDKLAKLLELQEKWEVNQARKAFVADMKRFKGDAPAILKNKHVQFGNTNYDHATLDSVCDAIIPALSKYGFAHRWKVEQAKDWIKVTCVLTHQEGHSEETTIEGPPDASGSKNGIQAIASAVTYLQRYSLFSATGLAAKNTDNDGRNSVTMGDLAEKLEWIENCRDLDELQKVFTAAFKEAKTVGDQNAMKAIVAAKDKKKRELL